MLQNITSNIAKTMKPQLSSDSIKCDPTDDDVAVGNVSPKSHQFNQGFVKFDLGVVHPPDRESFHVKSEFPRFKPKFEREFVENKDLEVLSANLLAWANNHFVTTGREAYFKELTSVTIVYSVYVNPLPELHSKDMELCTKFYFWLWFNDDVIEEAIEKKVPVKDLKKGTDQLESVLMGTAQKFADIPNYPEFEQMYNSLMNLHNDCISYLPGYEKQVQRFRKFLQKYFSAQRSYCIDEIDERYSEESFRSWRKVVAFFDGIAEVMAFIHGVTLNDDILRSSTLERILDIANAFGGFTNDLLGMKKEFENGQKDSLIVFLVLKKKMPLERAVQHVCKLMETKLLDYMLLKEVILKEFDQDENLVKYLHILDSLIDGHYFIYANSTRHRTVGSVLLTR